MRATTTEVRYPMLRGIAGFCRFVAWASLMVGLCGGGIGVAMVFSSGSSQAQAVALTFSSAVLAVVGFVSFLMMAESVIVLVDIEHNTRRTAELLEVSVRAATRPAPTDGA